MQNKDTSPWLLEVDNLHVHFNTPRGLIRAVEDISYRVRAGEVVALVGESGCGKSVSSLAIMRLLAHTGRVAKGRILFEGRDLLATIFHCLGYHPDTEVRDPVGRPLPISRGRVIEAIV